METIKEVPIRRYQKGRLEATRDRVVVEEPLEIRLGGEPFQVLMRLPGWEKELALGFLVTEGIVEKLAEVITMHFCGTATDPLLPPNVVDVKLTHAALARRGRRHLVVAYSSCGLCAKEAVAEIRQKVPPLADGLSISPPALLDLMDRLTQAQSIYHETGGTHAVALASPDGKIFLHAEDVGRHNAMDKVIGRAFLERRDFSKIVALLSGRLSFEMALKAIRAGIPILAAVSAPTTMALELAGELNLTCVGFARDGRLNVYTHPERIG
ncbi:MAG: formate dehydrogenase accessory sulfurtransferase FdhD [Deltaproteobacteria bacterium]|nr:formate dehydrogenase accessory sulfurtransferase FdhD [Deltaproteobacteria bacterium]